MGKSKKVTHDHAGAAASRVAAEAAALDAASRLAPLIQVDCAFARRNPFGSVELVLLQERRGGPDGSVETILVVLYDPTDFVRQDLANTEFREQLEASLIATGLRGVPGALAERARATIERLASVSSQELAMFPGREECVEAVAEHIVRTNYRSAITFLGIPPALRHWWVTQKQPAVPAGIVASASLSAAAVADLLGSWNSLAREIAPLLPGDWTPRGGQ